MPEWDREKQATTLTTPHKRLHSLLRVMGFEVEDEVRVGKYSLDCYVREVHCGFECDGKRYHAGIAKGKRDRSRDEWIFNNAGIPIMRIQADAISQVRMWDDGVDARGNTVKKLKTLITEFIDEHADDIDARRRKGTDLGV